MGSHGTHRSELLHSLIGKKVKVTFQDGTEAEGILKYSDAWEAPDWVGPGRYYLVRKNEMISFRKSSEKKVEEL